MQAVFRRRVFPLESFFQEGETQAAHAAHSAQGFDGPVPVLHHFSEKGQSHGDDPVFLGQLLHRLQHKLFLGRTDVLGVFGQLFLGPADGGEDLLGMTQVEKIDSLKVFLRHQFDFQVVHETGRGHPKVVAHQQQGLNMGAIALAEGLSQLPVVHAVFLVEPLLELVDDQDQFFAAERLVPSVTDEEKQVCEGNIPVLDAAGLHDTGF